VLTAERTARCHSVKSDDQLRSKGEPNAGAAHEGGRDRVAVDRRWREAAEFERRDGHARGEQHVVVAEEAEPDSGVACLSLPRPVYGIGRACYRAPAVGGIASHRCEPAGKTDTNGPPGPGESVTDQPMPAARAAALAALFNGLLLTAGRYCQAWLAVPLRPVGGPWLREGERARGKRLPGGRGHR
jgi:hypothetical protein